MSVISVRCRATLSSMSARKRRVEPFFLVMKALWLTLAIRAWMSSTLDLLSCTRLETP